jgi:dihydroorotase
VKRLPDLLIKGARLIDPLQGRDEVLDVLVSRGRISEVGKQIPVQDREVIEAEGRVMAPGFLDLHVHLREPGREEAETLESGLTAALRGGFTAVCCMPNTQPPLDNAAVIEGVYRKARKMGLADLFPVGCITRGREERSWRRWASCISARPECGPFPMTGQG